MILQFRNSLYNNKTLMMNGNANIGYFSQIVLRPNTFYCQKLPFLTDNEYSVFVADLCGNNLQEITEHCYFSLNYIEFTSVFDFYGQYVCLKIVNNINPIDIWFSNPIFITDEFYSVDLIYKNISENYKQRSGLNCYFTRAVQESEVKTYIQESGTKVSGKATFTEMKKYVFEQLDNFNYRNINTALANTIVYLDSLRITDKPLLKDADIEGSQNTFQSELTASVNYNDSFDYQLQIAIPLELVSYYPSTIYMLDSVENRITLTFNHSVDSVSSSIIKLFKDDVFYINLDLIQINSTTFEQVYNFTENGNYSIEIESGKFINTLYGQTDQMSLEFFIFDGEFERTEFDNTEFLVN